MTGIDGNSTRIKRPSAVEGPPSSGIICDCFRMLFPRANNVAGEASSDFNQLLCLRNNRSNASRENRFAAQCG